MARTASTGSATPTASADEAFFTGARHAHPLLDSIANGAIAARALIIGSAGSGKSTVLGRMQALLAQNGTPSTRLSAGVRIADVPPQDILFVDDLHLLGAEGIDEVRTRAADPDAALIVATRPWSRVGALRAALSDLEHTMPAVVAGHVIEQDVAAYLRDRGHTGWQRCLPQLLELTGGVTWLISEALARHNAEPCDDPRHDALRHALVERIAQRLDGADAALRAGVERSAIAGSGALADIGSEFPLGADDLIVQGYSEGLMLRNGGVPPVVRDAVHAIIPVHRLITAAEPVAAPSDDHDPELRHDAAHESPTWPQDHRLATLLCAQADRLLESEPARAGELYTRAVDSGMDAARLATGRVRAAWAVGDLDTTAQLLDSTAGADAQGNPEVADAAAAVWSARAMTASSSDVYAALPEPSGARAARATLCHLGAGLPDRLPRSAGDDEPGAHTTLDVALRLLDQGLRATLARDPGAEAIADLMRASGLYTASQSSLPISELPAVIAATAAMGMGDLAAAGRAIQSALTGGQGRDWGRRRLLLWGAWVAIQDERPADARDALRQAQAQPQPTSPRDQLLEIAVQMALTLRYDDVAALEAFWIAHRDHVRYSQFDLYLLQPLSALVAASARIGDSSTMAPHLAHALRLLERLGSPPLWSAHIQWAGIQQGILLNHPQLLAPYAHALVKAADHTPVAGAMSHAGRVWMAVLGGHVDADAVEEASAALAAVGLAWDGARLAGHGSARSDDRKDALRLLACGRRLHPREAVRPVAEPSAPTDLTAAPAETATLGVPATALSARELDVAQLVLEGKTYAEIGRQIFISPRTAEHHIARIRQRLGASNRSDLLAKLRVLIGPGPATPQATQHDARARPQSPIHPPRDREFPPIPAPDRPRSVAGEHTDSATGVLQ